MFHWHVRLEYFVLGIIIVLFVVEQFIFFREHFILGPGLGIVVNVAGNVGGIGVHDSHFRSIHVRYNILEGGFIKANNAFGHVPRHVHDLAADQMRGIGDDGLGFQSPGSVDRIVASVSVATTSWLMGDGVIFFVVVCFGEGVEIDFGEGVG